MAWHFIKLTSGILFMKHLRFHGSPVKFLLKYQLLLFWICSGDYLLSSSWTQRTVDNTSSYCFTGIILYRSFRNIIVLFYFRPYIFSFSPYVCCSFSWYIFYVLTIFNPLQTVSVSAKYSSLSSHPPPLAQKKKSRGIAPMTGQLDYSTVLCQFGPK